MFLRNFYLFMLLVILFNSCLGWGDIFSYEKDIPGNYEIAEDEGSSQKEIYYKLESGGAIGRIDNVLKVGWNDSIIIAESEEGYYILDKTIDSAYAEPKNVVYGPATHVDFINRLKKAQVKNIKFQIIYK